MKDDSGKITTIDEYIAAFPVEIQGKLNSLRSAIKSLVPDATEKISWGMPTFFLNGNLVHFACFTRHIGLYPGADGIAAFEAEILERKYKYVKGSVQFPHASPLPMDLIERIVRFREQQNRR